MRKIRALAFGLALLTAFCIGYIVRPVAAPASINLATPYAVGGGGQPAESDSAAALTAVCVDSVANSITSTFRYGTATQSGGTTTAFSAGTLAPPVTLTLNPGTATWGTSNGLAGNLTGAQVTMVNAMMAQAMTNARDSSETFATAVNMFGPGSTMVPW